MKDCRQTSQGNLLRLFCQFKFRSHSPLFTGSEKTLNGSQGDLLEGATVRVGDCLAESCRRKSPAPAMPDTNTFPRPRTAILDLVSEIFLQSHRMKNFARYDNGNGLGQNGQEARFSGARENAEGTLCKPCETARADYHLGARGPDDLRL